MDPINSLSRMIELLRRRVSSTAPTERASKTGVRTRQSQTTRPTRAALKAQIARRLEALDSDDPAHDARASRIFVEAIIAWEFGDEIVNDPKYADMIAQIDGQLQADEQIRSRFADMLRGLGGKH